MKEDLKQVFQQALEIISKGYQEAESTVDDDSRKHQVVWLSLRRFLSQGEAIIILCNNGHELEAMMLLRPLLELAINTRWVEEDDTGERLKKFLAVTKYEDKDGIPKMGGFWTDRHLDKRMEDIGFDEDYYRMVVKKLHEELHNHPARVARAYGDKLTAMRSDGIFSVAIQMCAHLLKSAHQMYPHIFNQSDPEKIVSHLKPSEWHLQRMRERKEQDNK